ncbi:PRTRC system protein E [Bifidobacterium panos]|uniref:PRTRC system protein E n=1 Tax=Bifidobacterium panos TaxID=2675321 RepID=A0ABX1SVB2_9BIFI|nr:PRTRC system protein E [Bifidobacterium sp. DSM 109963]NMN01771.1 PRTRC system protein E [Bifidobacterium sp. DSM 109963]
MPLELFSSEEFWTAVIVALVGGGGVGALIGAVSSRRKDTADIAAQACDILTDKVIAPLREQVEAQEEQITHLEKQQRKYFALAAYTRNLFHWLQQFCEIVEPDFLVRHPKPRLPDELRAEIAPETLPDTGEPGHETA